MGEEGILDKLIIGLAIALASAFFFGLNSVIVRIVSFRYPPKITVPATLFLGILITMFASLESLTRDLIDMPRLLLYALAGILNFGIARYMFYLSVTEIGATTTSVIISGNVVLTGVLGVLFLNEPSRIQIWIGLLLFLIATLMAAGARGTRLELGKKKGMAFALTASLIVALVNIVIRASNVGGGNPYQGLFISYVFGMMLYLLLSPSNTKEGIKLVLSGHKIVLLMGTIVTLGQLLRYISLDYIPAILAAPVLSTSMFFTLIIVGFLKQAKEKPTLKQAFGVLLGFLAIAIIYFT